MIAINKLKAQIAETPEEGLRRFYCLLRLQGLTHENALYWVQIKRDKEVGR
jgi:hypothetical protein